MIYKGCVGVEFFLRRLILSMERLAFIDTATAK